MSSNRSKKYLVHLCCQCPMSAKRRPKARGLCSLCYQRALKEVREGKTTWKDLEAANRARPPVSSPVWPIEVTKPRGRWLDEETFESDEHGLCHMLTRQAERTGWPRENIRFFTNNPCRYNDGEPILSLSVPVPILRGRSHVRVVPDAILDPIAIVAKAAEVPTERSYSDDDYLVRSELERALNRKIRGRFLERNRNRPSKDRPGEKALRVRPGITPRGKGPIRPMTYRLGDMRACIEEEANGKPVSKNKAKTIIHAHLLTNGPTDDKEISKLCASSHIQGIDKDAARKELKIRRVRHGFGSAMVSFWCLPIQEPPALVFSPKTREAIKFLEDKLPEGETKSRKELVRLAGLGGIGDHLLDRARPHANVVTELGWDGFRKTAMWQRVVPTGAKGGTSKTSNGTGSNGDGHPKPLNPKHVKWETWHEKQGLSLNQIVTCEEDEGGDKVTRAAVQHALKRLKIAREQRCIQET